MNCLPSFTTSDVDDINDLEKSFRIASFALLPSAMAPSRTPSNTLIASSRDPFFEAPLRFHIPYGLDNWSEVVDWYNKLGNRDSSAIDKMQVRKDHQHPYYHEYIVIFTTEGRAYRVDRRPDANAPFDAIMKEGCIAWDTIEEIPTPTSLMELDGTSDCVAELRWPNDQTVDLLFILAVCFRIHNDKRTKRYTLQHYNCYFLSWTIVILAARTTIACQRQETDLGWHDGGLFACRPAENRERQRRQRVQLQRELFQELLPKPEQRAEREGNSELQLQRMRELEGELELARKCERVLRLVRVKELARMRERGPERNPNPMQKRERVSVRELGRKLLELERPQDRVWKRACGHVWDLEFKLQLERMRQSNTQSALELYRSVQAVNAMTQLLVQVPIVLVWQLVQGWKKKGTVPQEPLWEVLQDAGTVLLPSELDIFRKTLPESPELTESITTIMMRILDEASGDKCRRLSNLAAFPLSFSVRLNDPNANSFRANTHVDIQYMPKATPTQLEEHVIKVFQTHAGRVARWTLGSKAETELAILDAIWRTWQNMSPLSYIFHKSQVEKLVS